MIGQALDIETHKAQRSIGLVLPGCRDRTSTIGAARHASWLVVHSGTEAYRLRFRPGLIDEKPVLEEHIRRVDEL